jgi:A/G-specific adenine glycosylase
VPTQLSSSTIRAFRRRILAHYDAHARDLPWRRESDPYRIWVSEVMLQQTRVDTVIPYYGRWLARFPDVRVLADAPEDDVLEEWAGLGYYSRARNLHSAARVVRDRHDCVLPGDAAALEELPGFGSYTAGAVASIAFGESVPAVDGNVKRVLGRAFAPEPPVAAEGTVRGPGRSAATPTATTASRERRIRGLANALVDPARPGDFNQALMDLGATICTPRTPKCGECPIASMCCAWSELRRDVERHEDRRRDAGASRAAGSKQEMVAAKSGNPRPGKPTRHRTFVVAVIVDADGRFLMTRRPLGGVLARMWAFPEVELTEATVSHPGRPPILPTGAPTPEAAAHPESVVPAAVEIAASLEMSVTRVTSLARVKHVFTHFTAHYLPVIAQLIPGEGQAPSRDPSDELRWVPPSLPRLAVPAAQKRIAGAAAGHLGLQVAFTEDVRS